MASHWIGQAGAVWEVWLGQELQRILTDRGAGLFHGVGEEHLKLLS